MALSGPGGRRDLQPDACHWSTRSENTAAGSELEEFFARGLIPRWHLAESLDGSVGPKAKACANSENWHCQPVLLRRFPLALTPLTLILAGPDWVILGLLQQRDDLSLLTSSHSPLLWTNVSPSYLFCRDSQQVI